VYKQKDPRFWGESLHSHGSTQIDRLPRPSLTAANGAEPFTLLGPLHLTFPGYARGGFSPAGCRWGFSIDDPQSLLDPDPTTRPGPRVYSDSFVGFIITDPFEMSTRNWSAVLLNQENHI
jgi:hypothetical protein